MAEETFVVLREAMRKTGKLAIARLVLSSRERVVTIGARETGMFVCTLRNPSEVRGTAEYFGNIPVGKPDPEMLQLAEALIQQKQTKFDPKNYEDRYEIALMKMIREKLKGHKPIIAAAPERGNVINLMDALKASLGQSKPPAKSKTKAEPAAEDRAAKVAALGRRQAGRQGQEVTALSRDRPSAPSARWRRSRSASRRARSSSAAASCRAASRAAPRMSSSAGTFCPRRPTAKSRRRVGG